jgi:hypothetical protein
LSAYTAFNDHYNRLLGRQARGGPPVKEHEERKLRQLWEAYKAWHDSTPAMQSSGGMTVFKPAFVPWEAVETELGLEPLVVPVAPARPRHRPADAFPWTTWERLDELLAARKEAKEEGGSIDGLSQAAIAAELSALPPGVNFDDTRVQRAEKARDMSIEAGVGDLCALLRSHPEFCTGGDMWSLPTPERVGKLLGF